MKTAQQIPQSIRIDGKKFTLSKTGSKSTVENHRDELIGFNQKERGRAGKSWRTQYKYRIKKYGNLYAIYTN